MFTRNNNEYRIVDHCVPYPAQYLVLKQTVPFCPRVFQHYINLIICIEMEPSYPTEEKN